MATDEIRAELALANRILARQGVVDGFGHVSRRDPDEPDRFLIARSMAPALVGAADILTLDFSGEPMEPCSKRLYLERHIHAAIYTARPDVGAVVHSHSPSVIPFGVAAGAALRPIYHMAGFLGDAAPVFEIRDHAGPALDMLIRDPRLGLALAETLGLSSTVLMWGHGATVVAATLRQAVFRAVYLEVNARLQAQAQQLGPVTFLSAGEASAADKANSGQVDRAWALWAQDT